MKTGGTAIETEDYTAAGALVVQGKNIQGRSCDWSDRRFVSFEKYNNLSRSHRYPGDLVFPKVGTIGKVGILTSASLQLIGIVGSPTHATTQSKSCRTGSSDSNL
jgi:hypothetical protein